MYQACPWCFKVKSGSLARHGAMGLLLQNSTVVTATDSTDRTAEVDWFKINRFNPGTSVRYDASPFKSQLPLLTLNINIDLKY